MPYCSAFGCTNGEKSGKHFYRFPKETPCRREWIRRVSRKDWKPTQTSVLCSDHFSPDSFVYDQKLLETLGFSFGQQRLKPGAIPSIFSHRLPQQERRSEAVNKRRRIEVG